MHIFKNPNYDFVRWKWQAIGLSWVVILLGGYVISAKGMPKRVEFTGGTIVIVHFQQTPDLDHIRAALPGGGANAVVQSYDDPSLNEVSIRVHSTGAEQGTSLSATAESVVDALNKSGLGPIASTCDAQKSRSCVVGTRIVGPTVGKELEQRGI